MRIEIEGRARILGEDVNTDYIISSRRKKETIDPESLKRFLLESIDPGFAGSVRPGDLLVAGRNFGCGSAMEVAVTVVLAAGIRAVLAPSFARTYYRNAINNGLIPIECDTSAIAEGSRIRALLTDGNVEVTDETGKMTIRGKPLPVIMLAILDAGGLIRYFQRYGNFRM